MKSIKYIIPALVAGTLLYAANDNEKDGRVKLEQASSQPVSMASGPVGQFRINGSDRPYALALKGIDDKTVSLRWLSPEPMNGYYEDFESHPDFEINSPGDIGWHYIDQDNQPTYTWAACSYPNMGQKMAFIVMNPSKTSPSVADYPGIKPVEGSKILAAFSALSGANNDYIVSPELNFDDEVHVSFRAKSYNSVYGLERIRVGYSVTGRQPSDFIFVSESPYEEVPEEWTMMSYTVPKEAKYVTINCVSDQAFMLYIDDIFIGTNNVRPKAPASEKVVGFNIYRDGVKVNQEPAEYVYYDDVVPEYGDYTYTVSAVYADGSESPQSEELAVNVPDIRLLPFEDDFETWVLDENKWSVPADEQGRENRWTVDYFTYGLVDPSATYGYSSIQDYSQSLVSTELNTRDIENIYLRFDLRTLNYGTLDGDTLSVEVSSDNTTWKTVHKFVMEVGAFPWRQEQFCLKDFLDNNLFRIRFRAHGASAFYLDYWYIDDVKVWNPEWTDATMSVTEGGNALAGCKVTLTAEHGAMVECESDNSGNISLPKIEKGVYEVKVEMEGYNIFTETWEISQDTGNHFDLRLTKPVISFSEKEITTDMLEDESKTVKLSLKNEGTGEAHWRIQKDYEAGSGIENGKWNIQRHFNASGDLQSSVVFDGEYYYTASWYFYGVFYKYDREGNFLEEFSIPGMYYKSYDFAFDGRYFYTSDNSNTIYQLDLAGKRIVRSFVIADLPDLEITHFAYDPRYDEFWVGGWNTICRVDREGKIKSSLKNIDENAYVYGSAFDAVSPGGPYLWFAEQGSENGNAAEMVKLVKFDLNTMRITKDSHSAVDIEGYYPGSEETGYTFICGLEGSYDIETGTFSLVGVLQQSPSLVFAYQVCEVKDWLNVTPQSGTIAGGETVELELTVNARDCEAGKTYSKDLTLLSEPVVEVAPVKVSFNVTGESATPRPTIQKAEVEDREDVVLEWTDGSASVKPDGYNVYRDGKKLNASLITEKTYTDKAVLRGTYVYEVTAVYGSAESVYSDKAEVFVKFGAPYYPPLDVAAAVELNSEVNLSWKSPEEVGQVPVVLRWDNGENIEAIGKSDGGFFYAGALWEHEDLLNYRGMKITEVEVFIEEQFQSLSLQIRRDNERIVSQKIDAGDITYGEFNTIVLDEPVVIEPGYSYNVAFLVAHAAGMRPMGMDNSQAANGKGNLYSENGTEWYPISYMGVSGNFNIAVKLEPGEGTQAVAPAAVAPARGTGVKYEAAPSVRFNASESGAMKKSAFAEGDRMVAGYNVYRDNVKVNKETVTECFYKETVSQPGVYAYTVTAVYNDGGESLHSEACNAEVIAIGDRLAPQTIRADVERNSIVRLRWNYPVAENTYPVDLAQTQITCMEGHPEYINSFRGNYSAEISVVSDGKFVYTSLHNNGGTFNKYTLDGTFVESFVIEGMDGVLNMAWDGEYCYAVDNGNSMYKLDLEAKKLVEKYSVSEIGRHIAYIPDLDNGKGGFEIGDWTTSIYVTRNGAKIGAGPTLKGAAGTAYHDGLIYAFEQGNANRYTITMYDMTTGKRVGEINMADYVELEFTEYSSAGGMSVFTNADGVKVLALVIQETAYNRFVFLQLENVKGVAGYNIYCNGEKKNDSPVPYRYFEEQISAAGEYTYNVETVYIDGTVSGKTEDVTVEIFDAGDCDAPQDVKAVPMSEKYNVQLSFVDPSYASSALYEGAEAQETGKAFEAEGWKNIDDGWTVTEDRAFAGEKALVSDSGKESWLILPVEGYEGKFHFSFVVANADDSEGKGMIQVLASYGSDNTADFIMQEELVTTEVWKRHKFVFDSDVKYIALKCAAGSLPQIVDEIAADSEDVAQIYGYDVMRDGVQINKDIITDISYIDRNMAQGEYVYQVRAHYNNSCISEFGDEINLDLSYSNGCQAPGFLTAEHTGEGVKLQWEQPALGDAVNIKWHSGTCYDAAGLPSGGSFFGGVRWTAAELEAYEGMMLTEVEFYINNIPDVLFILVYKGDEVVLQQYVPELRQYSFNRVTLKRPVSLETESDIKVVLYIEHNEITVPLGYDEGPAVSGKGDLYSQDGVTWSTLTANEIDGNWNITIGLSAYPSGVFNAPAFDGEQAFEPKRMEGGIQRPKSVAVERRATSQTETFEGYNVYCNSEKVNDELIHVTSYTDTGKYPDMYLEYYVTAVYSGCGEAKSNMVRLANIGLDDFGADQLYVTADRNGIVVHGAEAGARIVVTDAGGCAIADCVADGSPEFLIGQGQMPQGIYIVRVDLAVFKVAVK